MDTKVYKDFIRCREEMQFDVKLNSATFNLDFFFFLQCHDLNFRNLTNKMRLLKEIEHDFEFVAIAK